MCVLRSDLCPSDPASHSKLALPAWAAMWVKQRKSALNWMDTDVANDHALFSGAPQWAGVCVWVRALSLPAVSYTWRFSQLYVYCMRCCVKLSLMCYTYRFSAHWWPILVCSVGPGARHRITLCQENYLRVREHEKRSALNYSNRIPV